MSGVTPDWMKEQQRVDALLGTSANGYGSGNTDAPANPYATTGAEEPHIDPNSGQFVDTYGYFDPNNVQAITQYSNAMQEALQKGDNAAYSQALNSYRQTTGGLQPVWSYNITPDQVAMNSTNPGGVNYQTPAQQAAAQAASQPTPGAATTLYRDANGNLVSGTPQQAAAAHGQAPAGQTTPTRGAPAPGGGAYGIRRTPPGGIGAAGTGTVTDTSGAPTGGTTGTTPIRGTGGAPGSTGGIRNPATGIGQPGQVSQPTAGGGSAPTAPGAPTAPNAPGGGSTYYNPPAANTGGTGGAGGGGYSYGMGSAAGGLGATAQNGVAAPYGGAYQPPAFNPNQGLDPLYYGYQIGAAGNPSLSYIPDLTSNDPNRIYRNAQNVSYNYGAGNSAQIQNQQTQQSNLYNSYGQAADQAYSQLAQTPGYTDQEAANIVREPGYQSGVTSAADYASLGPTSSEQAGMLGDTASYGNYLNPQTFNDLNQANENQQYANLDRTGSALGTAQSGASTGINAALSNQALNPTDEYQRQAGMSDAEVDQQANAAARNIGLSSQAQIQDLNRSLAAAGIDNPLALATLRSRIQKQGQVNSADAVVDARLAARQAQRQAATGVQQTQLGAAQYQTGADIGAQQYMASLASQNALNQGQLTQSAQNQIAANQLASQQYVTNTGTAITEAQDAANQARQSQLYGIRQGNTQYQQQNQYNQAMGVNNALSQNYANVAQQRLTGQNQYRGYLTGQQGQALGAQQTAQNQQLTNYNAMTGALNTNAGQWGNYQIGKSSLPAGWQQIVGGVTGAVGAATQPTA